MIPNGPGCHGPRRRQALLPGRIGRAGASPLPEHDPVSRRESVGHRAVGHLFEYAGHHERPATRA